MHHKNSPVQINDTQFDSVASAADYYKVSCKDALNNLNKGMNPEKAFGVPKRVSSFEPLSTVGTDMPTKKSVERKPIVCGNDMFESIAAFARHHGLSPRVVGKQLKGGMSAEEIVEENKQEKKTLTLNKKDRAEAKKETFNVAGKKFEGIEELSQHFHVPVSHIKKDLRHGLSVAQAVGLAKRPPSTNQSASGAISLIVDGNTFSRIDEVAKKFGLVLNDLSTLLNQGYQCEAAVHSLLETQNLASQKTTTHKKPITKSTSSAPKESKKTEAENRIVVNGKSYESEREAASAHGVPLSTFYQRRKRGNTLEEALIPKAAKKTKSESIFCHGKEYDSLRTLAKSYGTSPQKLRYRIENVGMTPEKAVSDKRKKQSSRLSASSRAKIVFQDKRYPSMKAFAQSFGLNPSTVSYRLSKGMSLADAVGVSTSQAATPKKGESGNSITYREKVYPSVTAFAKAFNLPTHQVRYRMRKNWSLAEIVGDEKRIKKSPQIPPREGLVNISDILPIEVEGHSFDSAASLAKHYNLDPNRVTGRLRNGWPPEEAVELKKHDAERVTTKRSTGKQYRVGNKDFNSIRALASHFKVHYTTVRRRIAEGASAAQAVGKIAWQNKKPERHHKAKSVTYNGVTHDSYRALAEHYKADYSKLLARLHRGWSMEEAIAGKRLETLNKKAQTGHTPLLPEKRESLPDVGLSKKDEANSLLPEMEQKVYLGNLTFRSVTDFAEHLSLDPIVTLNRLKHGWNPAQIAGIEMPPQWRM